MLGAEIFILKPYLLRQTQRRTKTMNDNTKTPDNQSSEFKQNVQELLEFKQNIERLEKLVQGQFLEMKDHKLVNARWLAIAKTELEKGFLCLHHAYRTPQD